MVHTFRALGKFFLTDAESGSVFETDELTHYLVLLRIGGGQAQIRDIENKLKQYSAPEIEGADFELRQLISEGILFSGQEGVSGQTAGHGDTVPDPACRETCPPDSAADRNSQFSILNSQLIKALCLNVCHACNLRCGYCFAAGGTYGGAQAVMSRDVAFAAVDFLIERSSGRKNVEIDFFGGEPLLNFEVVKATVLYARSKEKEHGKKFRFTITTNGVNLDKEKIDFINKEFSNVVVSIDGREKVHNLMRRGADGGDTYRETVDNALALVKERKGDYFIRGTFTNKNLDFAEDVAALSALGFKHISMEPAALPDGHPLAIREEHIERVCREYETLAENLLKAGDAAPDFFHFRIDLKGAPCRDKLLKGCGAGGEYAAVSPDGRLYPCHQFDGKQEYCFGRLAAKSGVWSVECGVKDREPLRVPKYPVLRREACAKCWAKYYCGGGCAANSVNFCGGADKPYDLACRLLKKRTELAIALYCKSLD